MVVLPTPVFKTGTFSHSVTSPDRASGIISRGAERERQSPGQHAAPPPGLTALGHAR